MSNRAKKLQAALHGGHETSGDMGHGSHAIGCGCLGCLGVGRRSFEVTWWPPSLSVTLLSVDLCEVVGDPWGVLYTVTPSLCL